MANFFKNPLTNGVGEEYNTSVIVSANVYFFIKHKERTVMKNIYSAPEAIEVVLDTKDIITKSSSLVKENEGDGLLIEW